MTKEQMAATLNGREYGDEMDMQEERHAKASNLVVVFGYWDDNTEFRGAIHDECGHYGDHTIKVGPSGIVPEMDDEERDVLEKFGVLEHVQSRGKAIHAVQGKDGCSWTYRTEIPHATFDIMEDGEKFCRGIVFSLEDLK